MERQLAIQMTIKMADLGHVMAESRVHMKWVDALEEEYFRQGDQERAFFGDDQVSALMDRSKGGITKSQCGFFEIVVQPLYESFVQVFPGAQAACKCFKLNHELWKAVETRNLTMDEALKHVDALASSLADELK